MTREEADFINKLCDNTSVTWSKVHVEYQKKFVDPSEWNNAPTGINKDVPPPHGNQIEGNELCKRARAFKN
jgi:hypothetical protein